VSRCEHGYESIGARAPCPECAAYITLADLEAHVEALEAAVREYYSFLMGESYWELADELAARFPWVREEETP
jgi:hypothetical protein